MLKTVKITSSGKPHETNVANAETGVNVPGCYGFDLSARAGEPHPRATLFCYAELDVTADAEVVEVPRSLLSRAKELAARVGNPAVTAAFAELLGVRMAEDVAPVARAEA